MRNKSIRKWKKVLIDDLKYIAYELKELIEKRSVVILEGDLGSGKTTFSQAFIGEDKTFSPSYSILQETPHVLHADFYRLEAASDILPLELSLYLEDKQYFLVEWGLQYLTALARELPDDYEIYLMRIQVNDENEQKSRNFELFGLTEI
jgi:tRNA threonylcarbamoyladenosine biosynthesis protein TsaE